MDMKVSKKKLGLKEKYKLMTRDLGWEPTVTFEALMQMMVDADLRRLEARA